MAYRLFSFLTRYMTGLLVQGTRLNRDVVCIPPLHFTVQQYLTSHLYLVSPTITRDSHESLEPTLQLLHLLIFHPGGNATPLSSKHSVC